MGIIVLENMEFYGYHGHYSEEQVIGNHFRVDMTIETSLEKASQTDNLEDTIDYARVYELIRIEMDKPSHLIEHLAGRIVKSVHSAFMGLEKITVTVSKINPPVGGRMDRVSVILSE